MTSIANTSANVSDTEHANLGLILRGTYRPDLLRKETLPDILEATANEKPMHPAIIWQSETLTYSKLNHLADIAAHNLIMSGILPGQIIGLCLPRGAALLIMQAAITKAGAAWLPFESDTPVDRMQICLDDAQAVGMIAEFVPDGINCTVWTVSELSKPSDSPLVRRHGLLPEHPAYVIYTSGSTGKPKGVPISHGSICHFLRSENEVLGVNGNDKVYQGFSVAFDMSFEEIWISYLVGATLWLAPKTLTGDPDELPRVLQQENISVMHAVPTLLALFNQDIPGLRIINLGGEMCPPILVERWATPERKLFNTYGPTEATVSASLAELHKGQPVTIGTPLPNYGLLIRSEDNKLLAAGETGELCIIGPGVADGYLGRPELTAEKFLPNPYSEYPHESRLYRTGDLARIDENGQVQCLGRVDDQVKVRGFRVELGEIESALCQISGIATAAVVLRPFAGFDQLVAYLVSDAETPPSSTLLRETLRERLPVYMIPALFEILDELPRLTSGKIDRKSLRAREINVQAINSADSDEPVSKVEHDLFAALNPLFPGQPLRLSDDFFSDLGGHSLLAARLVSTLRAKPEYAGLAVHDVYINRTLNMLAARLQNLSDTTGSFESTEDQNIVAPRQVPAWRRLFCGVAQLLTLPWLLGLKMFLWLAPFFTYHWLTGDESDSVALAISVSVVVYILGLFCGFATPILGKQIILRKLKAGRYPLYGMMYFRWWLVDRLQDMPQLFLIAGSPLHALYLRAMGANIGDNTSIGTISIRAHDLLTIKDGASIGAAVNLENFHVESDSWEVGPIEIGKDAYIGSYSVLESHTTIEDNGRLEALSSLTRGQRVATKRVWSGAPSRHTNDVQPEKQPERKSGNVFRHSLVYIAGAALTSVLFFMPVFPSFILIDQLDANWLDLTANDASPIKILSVYFLLALPASAVMVLFTMLVTALLRRIFLPSLPAGRYPVYSSAYYCRWLGNQIQESSLSVLHGLYASIFAAWWYRLLGAKVGAGAEISTAMGAVPDLLTLGKDSFIADAVMLGDEEIDRGWMTLRPTTIGDRTFIGNGAYVADGTTLPNDVLVGVQTRAPDTASVKSGETWLGNPAISLPAREQTEGYPEHLTFNPSIKRRIARGFVETLRTILPMAVMIAAGYLIVIKLMPLFIDGQYLQAFIDLGLLGSLYGIGSFLFVVAAKWLLVGRYETKSAPMWTAFVWRSEAITCLYESLAVPNLLESLRGTPWLPVALRCFGAKIGLRVYMDTTDLTEFDCVKIGNDSILHAWSGPQTHLFEDRVMKIGKVDIGSNVNVGVRATVLYDSRVGDRSRLGPLTLVLKGESIPANQSWIGSPAVPWQR